MNNILNRILDLIEDSMLYRRELENFITENAIDLIENFTIILKFEDPNYIQYLVKANSNFRKLMLRQIKGRFTEEDCYNWIFDMPFNNYNNYITRNIDPKHKRLKIIRTNEEVYNELQKILKVIAHDIRNNQLNDIWYYAPKDINFQNNLNKLIELGYADEITKPYGYADE